MEYHEVLRQIVLFAFSKAKKETLQILKTPLSKHISHKIESDYKIYISEKTFIRYYDKFIEGKQEVSGNPNRKILDFLCKYIGFENLVDFYTKYSTTQDSSLKENIT